MPSEPAVSYSDKISERMAAQALQKHERGETPTAAELAALKRWEKRRDEAIRWRVYTAIPKGDWVAMAGEGRQAKTINEQAKRYGIPFGNLPRHEKINLPSVVQALHDFLARNKHKLAGVDEDPMSGPSSPAMERWRAANAALAEARLEEFRGTLLSREQVRQMLAIVAGILRRAGEVLQRQYGHDAHDVLNQAIDDAEHEVRNFFLNGQADHETSEPKKDE